MTRTKSALVLAFLLASTTGCPGDAPPAGEGSTEPATAAPTAETAEEAVPDEAADDDTPDPDAPADTWQGDVYTSVHFNLRLSLEPGFDVVDPAADAPDGSGAGATGPAAPPAYFVTADGMRFAAQVDGAGPFGLERSGDSLTFVGPPASQIYMVVGDTDSKELAEATFRNLDGRIGLGDVQLADEHVETRSLNAIPATLAEGDAVVRGEETPVRIVAAVLDLNRGPVAVALLAPTPIVEQCWPADPDATELNAPGPTGCEHGTVLDAMRRIRDRIEVADLRAE